MDKTLNYTIHSSKKHRQYESNTRKLCCRKDDRAMRPVYGCRENLRGSLTTVQ